MQSVASLLHGVPCCIIVHYVKSGYGGQPALWRPFKKNMHRRISSSPFVRTRLRSLPGCHAFCRAKRASRASPPLLASRCLQQGSGLHHGGKAPCRFTGKADALWSHPPPRKYRAPCILLRRALLGGKAARLPAALARCLQKCRGKHCGQPDEERQSKQALMRQHACKQMRHGRGIPLLPEDSASLRFKGLPLCCSALQLALQGDAASGNRQADSALSKPARVRARMLARKQQGRGTAPGCGGRRWKCNTGAGFACCCSLLVAEPRRRLPDRLLSLNKQKTICTNGLKPSPQIPLAGQPE